MNHSARLALLIVTCIAAPVASMRAAAPTTLLSEPFTSGIPANWRTDASTQSLVDGSSTPASLLDGNALRHNATTGAGSNGLHYSRFPATMLRAGETLSLAFDFKGVSYARNTGNFFNFGFLGGAGNASFSLADTVGYAMAVRMDARPNQTTHLRTFRTMAGGALVAAGSSYGEGVTTGSWALYPNDDNIADRLRFTFSITRLANGDLRLTALCRNVDGGASTRATHTVAAAGLLNAGRDDAYTFSGVTIGFLRAGSGGSVFDVDNISVTLTSTLR